MSLNRKKVAELRQLCSDRGLSTEGLKKSQLVELLAGKLDSDYADDYLNVGTARDDGESDDEVQLVSALAGNNLSTHTHDLGGSESASMREMMLKLQLVEAERAAKRERFEMERERRSW